MKKATYKFISPQNSNDNRLTILLGGELTVNTTQDLVGKFQEVMPTSDNFLVKIAGVEAIDLAFLQIIYSFVFTANELGKKVSIVCNLSPETTMLLKNSGVYNILVSENN